MINPFPLAKEAGFYVDEENERIWPAHPECDITAELIKFAVAVAREVDLEVAESRTGDEDWHLTHWGA